MIDLSSVQGGIKHTAAAAVCAHCAAAAVCAHCCGSSLCILQMRYGEHHQISVLATLAGVVEHYRHAVIFLQRPDIPRINLALDVYHNAISPEIPEGLRDCPCLRLPVRHLSVNGSHRESVV